ncbi:YggT family protein [Caminibacter pacificus]|jgi:YggT family protein|uniref:YggT family protein n=1 Tax=Caminibacter pacificus TaxID=1424653 RepID=A0AAJ4UYZ2_9BACT|nr:YggT family protein [Caminibacter pacificus]NPA87994.1 YggT family protein [Campylobacterota bacterium]QCI28064.1 YggT family protein [Caminibacter pacificus]ROR41228.1 YggT family protein [Caminibacter pacificus]
MNTILISILQFINVVIGIYIWVVIIAALITWVQPNPFNPIVRFLYSVTEPVYAFIRRYIPTTFGGFDIAPIILILALQFLQILINNIIASLY